MSQRERAFATEVAYTTLRCRRALETRVAACCPRGLPKDRITRAALVVAAAQILLLEHAAVPVAVDAAVTRVRAIRGSRAAGFVNAVLRQVAAGPKVPVADALRQNVADWLYMGLQAAVGRAETDALLGIDQVGRVRTADIRLRPGRPVPDWLADATPLHHLPNAWRVAGVGDLRERPGWQTGDFVVQEQGAQLIAWALDVSRGARVLDACAGRGQKSTLLAERVGETGMIWATDLHGRKLDALRDECARLSLANLQTLAVDWTVGGGSLPHDFAFALVDAPCTGTGTLYKRPEIVDRLTPDDPARMGQLAATILRNVATHCIAGAQIVYAVCSVLPEEGEQVLMRVADVLEPIPFAGSPLHSAVGVDATQVRLLPLLHGTDGYFVANLRRKS